MPTHHRSVPVHVDTVSIEFPSQTNPYQLGEQQVVNSTFCVNSETSPRHALSAQYELQNMEDSRLQNTL
jgi:hypothetical protein